MSWRIYELSRISIAGSPQCKLIFKQWQKGQSVIVKVKANLVVAYLEVIYLAAIFSALQYTELYANFAYRNSILHATLWETKAMLKLIMAGGGGDNSLNCFSFFYVQPDLSNPFQADLFWCDVHFNTVVSLMTFYR
jgi:hypothetical protein